MNNKLQFTVLAVFLIGITAFSAWRHYDPPEEQYVYEDEDIEVKPGPQGWQAKMKLPARRLRGRDLATSKQMDTRTRKTEFFGALRPIIREENARIAELRGKLIAAHAAHETPDWVTDLARSYKVKWSGKEWDALLARVDTVPMLLVLAQAANESSWGRSRFAQEGNNLFGMWCYRPGCGMIPARREVGKTHEVAAYSTINASVRAYLHTINTVTAYVPLRKMRAGMRAKGRRLDAVRLAGGLLRYSERGQDYVDEVRAMIRVNAELMKGKRQAG
jgi:Bax protein